MSEIEIIPGDQEHSGLARRSRNGDGPVLGAWYWLLGSSMAECNIDERLIGQAGRAGNQRLMCAI